MLDLSSWSTWEFWAILWSTSRLLEEIKGSSHSTWNQDTVTGASALLVSITTFEFLMAFYFIWKSLTLIQGLSISLHSSFINICGAYNDVTTTKPSVQHIRDNVNDFHSQWFHLAKSRAEAVCVGAASIPRCCGWHKNRNNTPTEDPKECFKCAITISCLGHVLTRTRCKIQQWWTMGYARLILVSNHNDGNITMVRTSLN